MFGILGIALFGLLVAVAWWVDASRRRYRGESS
jgi:hypothetical protein